MRNFQKILDGIGVDSLNFLLKKHPNLWNQRTLRKELLDSPHLEISDIWVRYNDDSDAKKSGNYSHFHDEHYPIWYPTIHILHPIRQIALALMAKMGGVHLGGILITKIPPGGMVAPHVDKNWHADFFNCKLYVPLQTNPHCVNRCEDEFVVMNTGDCWYFDNSVEHEVRNGGNDDRITLIICMRVE